MKKIVSIVTPCYNAATYIAMTIDSVKSQTYSDWEMIIVDDCSSDGSADIIKSYITKDSRIKYHKTAQPSGSPSLPRNIGIDHAKGKYIAFLDADDVWEPDKVTNILPFLQKGHIIQSNYSIIDGESKIVEPYHFAKSPIDKHLILNLIRQPFHGCCMAFPKSLLEKALPFPKDLIMHDNWLGLLGQMYGYDIKYIEKPLIRYRRYLGNVSPTNSNNPLWFKIIYRIKLFIQLLARTKTK